MSQALLHSFATQQACNEALTQQLAACIAQDLQTQNKASILLPGGSTPAGLLAQFGDAQPRREALVLSP